MAYSIAGIVNTALQRIGAKGTITGLNDGSPNAIRANTVWEYILNEVLEEIKPKFATVRVALAQGATAPANSEMYDYAYPLPADYLCIAEGSKDDPAISPSSVAPYVIETLADESLCLMTNYDSTTASYDIYLTYVRKVTNPGRFTASFINALANRLGAELSLVIPESLNKFDAFMTMYDRTRRKAKAGSRSQDSLADEKGSDSWETAGR